MRELQRSAVPQSWSRRADAALNPRRYGGTPGHDDAGRLAIANLCRRDADTNANLCRRDTNADTAPDVASHFV